MSGGYIVSDYTGEGQTLRDRACCVSVEGEGWRSSLPGLCEVARMPPGRHLLRTWNCAHWPGCPAALAFVHTLDLWDEAA